MERVFTKAEPLPPPVATYTISARGKSPGERVFTYLRKNYGNVPLGEIDSLFGFVERITLFANAGCALTCPSKLCYLSISKINKGKGGEFECSQPLKHRDLLGMVDFPPEPYIDRGFHRFKLLRARPGNLTGY